MSPVRPDVRSHVTCVVGARPNFMKMAPVVEALRRIPELHVTLVHTGQHYDDAMSRVFFEELGLPAPDVNLEVGSGSHAAQTARVLERFDALLESAPPARVVVAGDVNSTLACALAAAKRRIPLAHVEAGLRSGDRGMPEEINRIVTDALADLRFATSADAVEHLLREGCDPSTIHLVGNSMIDSVRRHLDTARRRHVPERLGVPPKGYALVTLHRPSNVDDPRRLGAIITSLGALAALLPVLVPAHPRTALRLASAGIETPPGVRIGEPLGYLDFLGLMDGARLVITDSGGIQEETTALGVSCLTLRDTTERPVTIAEGTNRLIGADPRAIVPEATAILEMPHPPSRIPPLWDGQTGERIAWIIARELGVRIEATPNAWGGAGAAV